MKVLYYSSLAFTDCDFPLIKRWQAAGLKVDYFLTVLCSKLHGALFKIKKQDSCNQILTHEAYPEFDAYKDYLKLNDVRFLNRVRSGLHPKTFWLYLKFVIYILRTRPDVIHVTHPLWGAEWLLYLFAHNMVMTVHDPFVHSGEGDRKEHISRKIAFKLIPKFVLLNDRQKEDFINHYGIDPKKVFVNSLGVYDCLKVTESETNTKLPSKYVLLFGRISPYKGIDVLCEAMKKVHNVLPDLHCIIAGGGKMYFDYSPYEAEPYMHLMNRYIDTPELGELIKHSIFTICPYKDATQSGVVYSSLAYNKPVIASNVGALGDAIIDGISGMLVEPNNPSALADAIIKLAGQEELLKSMSSSIQQLFYEGERSWKSIANKYIEIYES